MKLYYTPPSDDIFNEVKQKAIEIWQTHDDTYGYASEEVNQIKDLENIGDNLMTIVAMFDLNKQSRLALSISLDARTEIINRLIESGVPNRYNAFKDPLLRLRDIVNTLDDDWEGGETYYGKRNSNVIRTI